MKRVVGLVLAALMVLTALPSVYAEEAAKKPEDFTGTLNIWSWTDDPVYQIDAFKRAYPNVDVKFTQIGEGYDVKIQTIVANGAEGPDVFCADVKVAKNYTNDGAWENLSAAPYNANELTGDVIQYTKDVASDADGNLRALSWQATPGGLWYKRSMAKKFFGTDDPAEISKLLKDTDSMLAAAEVIKEKSNGATAMIPNYQDLWIMACYSMRKTPWVVNDVFQCDPYVDQFFDLCKTVRDNGYDAKLDAWQTPWYAAAAIDSLFGYVLPTWGLQYVIMGSAPDSKGDWAIASMPAPYFNGGTYMGIYSKSKAKALAWEYIKFVTLNKDYVTQYAKDKSDFPALISVADQLSEGYQDGWCGGQNTFAFFEDQAQKINASLVTEYDDVINGLLLQAVTSYVDGSATKEEAIQAFKDDVANTCQNLTVE